MRDALGRLRPKYGHARRYTQRKKIEGYEAELRHRRLQEYRNVRVNVYRPDRVNIRFSSSPNRKPGTLKNVKVKR